MSEPTPIAVAGAGGRMGRVLIALAARDPALRVAGAFEAPGHAAIGLDAGALAGVGEIGVPVLARAEEALSPATVLVEFTWPEPSLEHLEAAAALGSPAVLGTTGFDGVQQERIAALATRIPIVQASNMSVGVTALVRVVRELAARLGERFDIEVLEMHHGRKKDAPSGTALTLARAAAEGRGLSFEESAVFGRHGLVGERRAGELGVMALRGGDVVGDHTVFFLGSGERIELTHRAQSREAFASGALRAARWLAGRPAGRYSMEDVLFGASQASR